MTRFYYALTIPLNRKMRVARDPGTSTEVDVDALCRLVAIANQEGLRGQEIVGLICKPDRNGDCEFQLEHLDRGGSWQ